MDTRTLLEAFGWVGSALVILSLVLASQQQFRLWNLVGSFIATTYNIALGVWPAVAMNGLIVLIDSYWLIRLGKEKQEATNEDTRLIYPTHSSHTTREATGPGSTRA